MASATALFTRTAAEVVRPAAVVCGGETPCTDVLALMAEAGAACAVITRADGQVLGLLTEHLVVSRITHRLPPEAPVAQAVAMVPRMARDDDPLYRVWGYLRDGGLPSIPVVNAVGQLLGLVSREQLQLAAAPRYLAGLDRYAHAAGLDGLGALKLAQTGLAADLLADHVEAPAVQATLSAINDDIYRDVVTAALESLEEDGWGRPPVDFAVIIMGSGGRGESFLAPDQDNGLVIADYADAEHGAIDGYFGELAARMTRDLDAIGIPYCQGYVMATNPVWRKTFSQWLQQVQGWIRKRTGQGFLNASILLDFRGVYGDPGLSTALREQVVRRVGESRTFLRALTLNESTKQVGLGWFDRLLTETREGAHEGELNIKRNGIMPIVEAVRLFALARGVVETSTAGRMERLAESGSMSADDLDALSHAHAFMCLLLLRQQVADLSKRGVAGQHVEPRSLTRREHDTLVRSMKVAQSLLRRLHNELVGASVA